MTSDAVRGEEEAEEEEVKDMKIDLLEKRVVKNEEMDHLLHGLVLNRSILP